MKNATQQLIERDISARQENRRAICVTEPRVLNYDTAAINTTVIVVDVNIGAARILKDVIVQSTTGKGGRDYAQQGKPVIVQRNGGGRWIVVGPSDRVKTVGCVQILTEETDVAVVAPDEGFTYGRRHFGYYADNEAYGVVGYGNTVVYDAAIPPNEVP